MRLTLIFFLIATQVAAEEKSYANHKAVQIYSSAPCRAVVEAIDAPDLPPPGEAEIFFYGRGSWLRRAGQQEAVRGMAWGFLLGFDAANGGLNSEDQTTLERLRAECAKSPDKTALEILNDFIESEIVP